MDKKLKKKNLFVKISDFKIILKMPYFIRSYQIFIHGRSKNYLNFLKNNNNR